METIYYFQPCPSEPAGGLRIAYRHVDLLNRSGRHAAILHPDRGYRYQFASSDTRVEYLSEFDPRNCKALVLPEFHGSELSTGIVREYSGIGRTLVRRVPRLRRLLQGHFEAPDRPTIIFNQNVYNTFKGYGLNGLPKSSIYERPNTRGIMCVSDDSYEYLRLAFPRTPIMRVVNSFDFDLFRKDGEKKRQIAFMTRKNIREIEQVICMLRSRNSLAGFQLKVIDGVSESGVADILKESAIFLSFGPAEGFSMPPVEAMLSGCYVVGYHGQGAREYFDPSYCAPIQVGDISGFVRAAEAAIELFDTKRAEYLDKVDRAYRYVRTRYSNEAEEESVLRAHDVLSA